MVTDSDCGLLTVSRSDRDKELLFLCGNWRAKMGGEQRGVNTRMLLIVRVGLELMNIDFYDSIVIYVGPS